MTTEELYQLFLSHPNISTDSRNIKEGCLFFALKGANFNGNQFAANAIAQGAAYAIIDEKEYVTEPRIVYVENVLESLQELARFHRQQLNLPILAITGSNGKTTTKELTAAVLSKKFNLIFTQGNLNNHIGVPLTLLSMTSETELGIVEMGANHPGEIATLSEIALPNHGLITNVGKAHIEGFGSFEGVKKTKAELYRFVERTGGKIFINQANPHLREMARKTPNIPYTTNKDMPGLQGELIEANPFMVCKIKFPKGWLYIKTRLIGGYNLENALAAATVGSFFGIDPLKIKEALESYVPANNRSQFIKSKSNQLQLDAYNANPSSMQVALDTFQHINNCPKGVILGDMLELGTTSAKKQQKVVDRIAANEPDFVLLVGPEFSRCQMPESFKSFRTTEEAKNYLENFKPSGFYLLIKGSRGMKLESLVEKL